MYTQLVAIGYQIPTVGAVRIGGIDFVECGWAPPLPPNIGTLHAPFTMPPPLTNPDMQNRFLRLAYVINKAYRYYYAHMAPAIPQETSMPHSVLKVFTVPEFYFRPPGAVPGVYGAYTLTEFMELSNAIETLLSSPLFADWLFVCGTALFSVPSPGAANPLICNYALLQMSGRNGLGKIIYKEMTSDIDGVPPANSPNAAFANAVAITNFDRNRVLADLGIGVEICLDHGEGVLKRVLGSWGILWGLGRPDIKLHILVAGGMPVIDNRVAAIQNRYVFRNDGMCAAVGVELRRAHVPILGAVSTTPIASAHVIALPMMAQVHQPPNHPFGPYTVLPQQIVFFPPQPY